MADKLDVEQNQSSHHYQYKKDFKTALPQILAVSVKNLLLLGMYSRFLII